MMDDNYLAAPDCYQRQPYRPAGRHGLRLPGIGLGLWHNFGAGSDPATAKAMVHQALIWDHPSDLANNTGAAGIAELTFGTLLKGPGSYRDELIIASKAGYVMWDGPYGDGGSEHLLPAAPEPAPSGPSTTWTSSITTGRIRTPLEETASCVWLP